MQNVLITGASSGLGAAMARHLARLGYGLILTGRNTQRLHQVCKEARGFAARAHVPAHGYGDRSREISVESIVCDLSSQKDIESLVRSIEGRRLDILINNAGIAFKKNFEETPDAEWMRQWEVNMMGPVRLTRLLFPHLRRREPCPERQGPPGQDSKGQAPQNAFQGGSSQRETSSLVIHISSTAALRPVPGLSAYSAVKAAMVMWTQSLAQEWGPYGIRVNCICPGIVNTPIQAFHGLPEDQLQEVHRRHPLGRMGRPEDIAQMVGYLMEAHWVTGSIMKIDGGISLG